jgi:hypothetical protein
MTLYDAADTPAWALEYSDVDIEPIETWLRTMGCTPVKTENPTFRWSLRFDFPATSNHVMEALCLSHRPGSVVVLSKRSIDARLVSSYETLSEDAKDAFNTELTSTLLRDYIEYHLDQTSRASCAPRFQVLAERFDDGLTLDAFYGTVDHVYKTELAVIMCYHKHLARAARLIGLPASSQ